MKKIIPIILLFFSVLSQADSGLKRNWEIIFIPHTHLDIGYTDIQENVLKKQWNNLQEAMDLIEKSEKLPKEAQFRWSPEAAYIIETFLNQASAEDTERFFKYAKSGHIGIDGFFANLLVGLSRPEELRQALSFKEKLEKNLGRKIDSVMITDVPGWSWSLVELFSRFGIKYLSLGPNPSDRVGNIYDKFGDRPFYWVSPSGAKVLTFIHGKGYTFFHKKNAFSEDKIFKYLQELEEKNYPYNIIPIRFSEGDNGPPNKELSDKIILWNKKHQNAKISLATTHEALKEFEKRYGDQLPEFSGEFTPYWTDGAASTAKETSLNLRAAEELDQAQTLFTLLKPNNFPHATFHNAWNEILLFSEHTWGAYNSISRSNGKFTQDQWDWKKQRALNAKKISSALLSESLKAESSSSVEKYIRVFNTHSWPISGPVVIKTDTPISLQSLTGEKVTTQFSSSKTTIFLAKDVPPLSYKTYLIQPASTEIHSGCEITQHSISNGVYRVQFDPKEGTIESIFSIKTGKEFVNSNFRDKFNEYIYVSGKNPVIGRRSTIIKKTSFEILEKGPLVCSLKISRIAIGNNSLTTIVTLMDNAERIDIENILDRPSIKRKEGIHFAFPVAAINPKIHYDVAWGSVEAGKDQLEGSCKNYFTPLRWVDISGDDLGMMIVLHDAPLFEAGAITMDAGRNWNKDILENGAIYSYVMNNYWHTNYKADQPGITSFKYSLFPHLGYDVSLNNKKSLETLQPLMAQKSGMVSQPELTGFSINNNQVIIESIKVVENGVIELDLFNTSDRFQSAHLIGDQCRKLFELETPDNLSGRIDFSKHAMKRVHCIF